MARIIRNNRLDSRTARASWHGATHPIGTR